MTSTEFTAHAVAYQLLADVEAKVLVLAEDDSGQGRVVELQRALFPTDYDPDPDELLPCIVLDSGPTHFGGIDAWQVADNALEIRFSDDAAATLGTSRLLVRLISAEVAAQVRQAADHLIDDGPDALEFTLAA